MRQIGSQIPIRPDARIRRRHEQILTAFVLIHRRDTAAGSAQCALPELLAGLGIVDVKFVVSPGDEHETSARWNDAELEVARCSGAGDAETGQTRIVAKRNLPF